MTALLLSLTLPQPGAAQAGSCFADYKAQRTDGGALQLHYGVIEVPPGACAAGTAPQGMIAARIGVEGWKLLRVLSVFGRDGLEQRRANAGTYFLRY